MGSCISKCNLKRTSSFYELRNNNNNIINQVQDKLVISSSQIAKPPNNIPILCKSNKISPVLPVSRFNYSYSPTSSFSNATTTTTTTSITSESSLSSLSSTASSSILSSKDRSFSNEFLWSCLKENPHVIRINSIKEAALPLPNSTPKTDKVTIHPQNSPFHTGAKQPNNNVQQRIISRSTISTTPQKRVRSTSPINAALLATRQKSFRSSSPSDSFSSARIALRSPSLSRRFTGGEDRNYSSRGFNNIANKESSLKRVSSGTKKVNLNPVHSASSFPSSLRKDNKFPRSGSPASCNGSMGLRPPLSNRETCTHRIGSKIDEVAVKLAMDSHQESDHSVPMEEDINNPHISLDCFIFL